MKIEQLKKELKKLSSSERAKASAWFFKTGPGQYGEGDQFLGVSVPDQRKIAREFRELPLEEVEQLLKSPVHEERLTSLFILVDQFQSAGRRSDSNIQKQIYNFYLANAPLVNNWDLVDSSAGYIVGTYLLDKPREVLYELAGSNDLWEKRIAMVATSAFINQGDPKDALKIAETLLNDKHDLIQKAVGWMLREVGKRCGRDYLVNFLDKHSSTMPRTALRYAIEHFPDEKRQAYLKKKPS